MGEVLPVEYLTMDLRCFFSTSSHSIEVECLHFVPLPVTYFMFSPRKSKVQGRVGSGQWTVTTE